MKKQEPERDIRALEDAARWIRRRVIEMTSEAGSGHATTSLSATDLVTGLFFHAFRYDVANPSDPRNDRFVLSKGHGAPLLYAAWAAAGAIEPERLQTLRRFDSELEGHPTPRFPWVEVATGSLGQGLSAGVGMAIAARMDGSGSRVWVLLGDGETAEGAVWEAAALASHRRLDNLVAILDVNRLGQTEATMIGHDLDAYARRLEGFGWRTIAIDGHDLAAVVDAFDRACETDGRPTAVIARTIKGKGVSFIEDRDGWHGKALKKGEEMERALAEIGEAPSRLAVRVAAPEGQAPRLAAGVPDVSRMPPPRYAVGDEVATRDAYGEALRKLGELDPRIVALDGDVKDSTRAKTVLDSWPERLIECFIAEQNMIGTALGLQARGRIPFCASFACFLTRAFDQIRMAAISRANLKICGSHAGVSIGEDGPSQMGLEDLAMMRAIPGSVVLYPSDATSGERLVALAATHPGIAYVRTNRPKTPVLYPPDESFRIGGSKCLRSSREDRLTIVAAGITVHEALEAWKALRDQDGIAIRVLDLYSVKPVDREGLLAAARETDGTVLVVEDHYPEGGLAEAVRSALATDGVVVHGLAVREVPRSGPKDTLLEAYGIGAKAIAETVRQLIATGLRAPSVGGLAGQAGA